jgi:hypothetical protein
LKRFGVDLSDQTRNQSLFVRDLSRAL